VQVRQVRHPRRTGRFCRTFENRRSRHRLGAIGCDADIPDGEKWLGSPAQPDKQAKRQYIAIQHLPETAQARRGTGKAIRRQNRNGMEIPNHETSRVAKNLLAVR